MVGLRFWKKNVLKFFLDQKRPEVESENEPLYCIESQPVELT